MGEYNSLLGAFFSGKDGNSGYNAGFRQSRLAKLYQSQDPAEQEAAARQLAAVDPESAGKWQEQQAKVTQQRLEQKARMLASLPSLEQKQSLYASMLPDVRKSWAEAPDQYTPELDQALSAWAGNDVSKQSQDPADVRSFQYFTQGMTPEQIALARQKRLDIAPPNEKWTYGETKSGAPYRVMGEQYQVLNPQTQQWQNYGGKQFDQPKAPPTPQGATLEEITATAEKMFADGASADEVNRWTAQQTNAYYLSKGEPATNFVGNWPKDQPAAATQEQLDQKQGFDPFSSPDKPKDAPGLGDINTLRDDYTKAIQQPVAVMNAYEKMRDAAQDPSPAGDIALIYAYMKILDPTSVVREGEFATAQNAGSVPDSIWNTYNRMKNGERLAINRGDFLLQGAKLYASSKQQYNQVRQQFGGIVQRNGINPADVLVDGHKPISQKYPAKGQVYKPQTDADFAKIPSGGIYIDPDDGKQYRKK